jgi:hypothetical protein
MVDRFSPPQGRNEKHKKGLPLLREPFSVIGGADRIRTGDLRVANASLSQLSYCPIRQQNLIVKVRNLK